MPLNASIFDTTVDRFDPLRNADGTTAVVTGVFPASEVLITYYTPTGEESPLPWSGQQLHHARVHAPGVSPFAVQSAEVVLLDYHQSGPAVVRVTYQTYKGGEHVASAADEKERLDGLAKRRGPAADAGPARFTVYKQPDGVKVEVLRRDGVTAHHVARDSVDVINIQLSEGVSASAARNIAHTLREVLRGKEGTVDPRDARIEQLEAALRSAKLEHQHHAVAQEGLIGRMKEERDQARAAQITAQAESLQNLRAANNFSAALAEARRYIDKGDAAARTAVKDLLIRTEIAENSEVALRDTLRNVRSALGLDPLPSTRAEEAILKAVADLKAKADAAPDLSDQERYKKCCIRNGGVIRNIAAKLGLQPTPFSTVEAAIIRRIDKLQGTPAAIADHTAYEAVYSTYGDSRRRTVHALTWEAALTLAKRRATADEMLCTLTKVTKSDG